MATNKDIQDANRMTSLTYMISACLGFSIERLNYHLKKCNLVLAGEDKRLFNTVSKQINQLHTNLKILEDLAFKVMGDDDEGKLAYEDAIHLYWVLFMVIIDRAGTDNLYDLRIHAFVEMIGKYKSLLELPGLEPAYYAAFAQVSKAIQEGKYSTNDFKNLLEVYYEDRAKETKG